MAAVPIYVWNGSAWQEIGPTIPATPIAYQASASASPSTGDVWVDSDGDVTTGSQQFQRFRFVASGGETTISGADADGAILAYTAGLEQVILNGAVLVRGQDYTATDGTNITGLSPALVASDVLEVFSFIAFTVANTYTQSQVDGLVAAATAEPGMKLIVPTSATNGTVSASGAVTFSAVSSVSLNGVFSSTYDNYLINVNISGSANDSENTLRLRASGTDNSSANYQSTVCGAFNSGGNFVSFTGATSIFGIPANGQTGTFSAWTVNVYRPNTTDAWKQVTGVGGYKHSGVNTITRTINGYLNSATQFDGFTFLAASGNITGTVRVYGLKN